MRKYQKSESGRKSKKDKSRPASESPFRKEGTEKEIARVVMPRRWKALPATGAVAALIAERDERDDELAEQITRSFEWRRRSKAHVENDLGGVQSEKRVRVTVKLEEDLVRTAQSYTGIKQKSALIQIALTQLIEREAARRLAAMGGTMPKSKEVPRSRLPGK
jgi:Arc/MetJ family transcription regulator